jgi:hypothetical protein
MIKAERNKVHLKGNDIDLLSELTMIVDSLKDILTKTFRDEEDVKDMIEEAVRIAFLSEEEKNKEVMDILKSKKADAIIEKFMERMFK